MASCARAADLTAPWRAACGVRGWLVGAQVAKKEALSRGELEQFVREVALLRRLHHRNVVQAYGVCLGPGAPCLVTELMKGGDMWHALRHHPALMRCAGGGGRVGGAPGDRGTDEGRRHVARAEAPPGAHEVRWRGREGGGCAW